jgi:hypothetical protein
MESVLSLSMSFVITFIKAARWPWMNLYRSRVSTTVKPSYKDVLWLDLLSIIEVFAELSLYSYGKSDPWKVAIFTEYNFRINVSIALIKSGPKHILIGRFDCISKKSA